MGESPEIQGLVALRLDHSDRAIRLAIKVVCEKYQESRAAVVQLARILAESGEVIQAQGHVSADLASTGGVSSLSTLICPLYLRASGATVPKLGVPGRPAGGIDSLAQIPGYRTNLSRSEVDFVLKSGGYAHFLAKGDMAPLDGKMFAVRQETGAQAVPTLVAASLLAKKLAVGVRFSGLEIRVAPHGNFGTTWESAVRNARLYIDAAKVLEIEGVAVLTEGRYPYQPYLGRREALVAVHSLFEETASSWLEKHHEHCRRLALATLPDHMRPNIKEVARSELRSHFDQNLRLQGANPDSFDSLVAQTKEQHRTELVAAHDGFSSVALPQLRGVLVAWQKRLKGGQDFSDPVGLILSKESGAWVQKGETIATVRAEAPIIGEVRESIEPLVCFPSRHPIGPGMESIDG